MWLTVLVMALAVSLEPFRIGMTVLMLNRPRPMLQLAAFLCGGIAMGMTVGLIVLFVLRRRLLDWTFVTVPHVQILIGALALLAAAAVATKHRWARPRRESADRPTRRLLQGTSLWLAAAAGLGIALPSVDYLAALTVILASGSAAATQVGALALYHAVAFTPIEIPLLAYVFAPRATQSAVTAVNAWIRSRSPAQVAIALAVVGAGLLTAGVVTR